MAKEIVIRKTKALSGLKKTVTKKSNSKGRKRITEEVEKFFSKIDASKQQFKNVMRNSKSVEEAHAKLMKLEKNKAPRLNKIR